MKSSGRITLAPAFLLHHMAWRDTSRILEFLTREHGRVSLFARGVRSEHSELRAVLRPFQRVLISWSGRGEAGNLNAAELDGAPTVLPAGRLLSGFYLNELLMKLLARHDSHPQLFDRYEEALAALRTAASEARTLRIFEKRLLQVIGYGIDLERDADSGAALEPDRHYHFRADRGATLAVAESPATYRGSSLNALAAEALDDAQSLRDARRLLRDALTACLDGRSLKSREVMRAVRAQEIKA
jgi:DNA repair protein RecO (recombination protein O)